MFKRLFLISSIFLFLEGSGQALNPIDTFIRDRCTNPCTGDTDQCRLCYNRAVDLYDQSTRVAPDGGLEFNQGKLEFSF